MKKLYSMSDRYNMFMILMSWLRKICFGLCVVLYPHWFGLNYDYFCFFLFVFYFLHMIEFIGSFVFINFMKVEKKRTFLNYLNDIRMIFGTTVVIMICGILYLNDDLLLLPKDIISFIKIIFIGFFVGTISLNIIDFSHNYLKIESE